MRKRLIKILRSEKTIIIVTVLVLLAISLIVFRENMTIKTYYFVCRYFYIDAMDGAIHDSEKVVIKKVKLSGTEGNAENYVFLRTKKDDIIERYEEVYDTSPYGDRRRNKDLYLERWRAIQKIMYEERMDEYIENLKK